jgi:hypothetical protein|tara:strand:+ start:662 stop:1072 length:411 start_codon:yes stop_codon:yes gene_type:complete
VEEEDDIFKGLGIEVSLNESEDFLKIKETLTRIGVSSRKEKKLYQSCHILHKRGRYVILHFKELFELDGLESNISDEDIGRRNTIVNLLQDWGLLAIVDVEDSKDPVVSLAKMKIIPHREKDDWDLVPKYHIGRKK